MFFSCEKLDPPPTLFEVSGYEMADSAENAKPFKYLTKNVVLATGRPILTSVYVDILFLLQENMSLIGRIFQNEYIPG